MRTEQRERLAVDSQEQMWWSESEVSLYENGRLVIIEVRFASEE